MPMNLAIAQLLAKVAGTLADIRDEKLSTEDQIAKSGLYYLLKIKDAGES